MFKQPQIHKHKHKHPQTHSPWYNYLIVYGIVCSLHLQEERASLFASTWCQSYPSQTSCLFHTKNQKMMTFRGACHIRAQNKYTIRVATQLWLPYDVEILLISLEAHNTGEFALAYPLQYNAISSPPYMHVHTHKHKHTHTHTHTHLVHMYPMTVCILHLGSSRTPPLPSCPLCLSTTT